MGKNRKSVKLHQDGVNHSGGNGQGPEITIIGQPRRIIEEEPDPKTKLYSTISEEEPLNRGDSK